MSLSGEKSTRVTDIENVKGDTMEPNKNILLLTELGKLIAYFE